MKSRKLFSHCTTPIFYFSILFLLVIGSVFSANQTENNSLNLTINNSNLSLIESSVNSIKKPTSNFEISKGVESFEIDDENIVIIQFSNNLDNVNEKRLRENGITKLSRIDSHTYIFSVKENDFESSLSENKQEIGMNNKLHKNSIYGLKEFNLRDIVKRNLIEENFFDVNQNDSNYTLIIYVFDGFKERVLQELDNYDASITFQYEDMLQIDIPKQNFQNILDIKGIKYVQEVYPLPSEDLSKTRGIVNAEVLINISGPYNLSGESIKGFQYEAGVGNNSHSDLGGRLIWTVGPTNITEHATMISGIIIGNGTINSSFKGIANKGILWADTRDTADYNYTGDIILDYIIASEFQQTSFASNSWGYSIFDKLGGIDEAQQCSYYGNYESLSQHFDKVVSGYNYSYNKSVIVFSVGNERNTSGFNVCNQILDYNLSNEYYSISPPRTAKNIVSVGSIDITSNATSYFSATGPTDDGRIKPELVAPGYYITSTSSNKPGGYNTSEGTSLAAPHVSGTIALMLEQWNISGYYSSIGDPLPSTIKALLLDSTTDLNSTGNGDQIIDGPDYKNGYGLLNAKGAVDRIINGSFLEAEIQDGSDEDTYTLQIPYDQQYIKVTLAWDDPPAELFANPTLVHDLDLSVLSPDGTRYYPWTLNNNSPSDLAVRTQEDHLNNVEQVYINRSEIESEGIGTWKIVVNASSCSTECPQKYSLVSEQLNMSGILDNSKVIQSYTNLGKHNGSNVYETIVYNPFGSDKAIDLGFGNYSSFDNFSSGERKVHITIDSRDDLELIHTVRNP